MEHLGGKYLIVRVDANTQIGTGHLMRCLALAQAWMDAGGRVVFITACQNEDLLQRLREEEFDIHLVVGSYPDTSDWEYTKDILTAHPNAWVVLDGYHFDEVYQQQVKEAGHRLLVIDDMAYLNHYYADIVLNQDLGAEQLQYSCEPQTCLLLGTHYVLLRREFLAWRGWKREIPELARRVLVTFGGGDPENHTLKVIQALQKVDVPGLEAIIVIGACNPHADVLEAAARQGRISVRLIRDAGNMPELMSWADMAVSSSGTTVWELLFLGTPTLILILADNQRYTPEQIEGQGAGESLGWARNIPIESLAKAIALLMKDLNLRAKISRNARQIVDGQGTERVLNSLEDKDRTFIQVSSKADFTNPSEGRPRGDHRFKVVFLGGKQAGCVGLLTVFAAGCRVQGVVAYDRMVENLAEKLGLPTFASIKKPEIENLLRDSDLLISVHCQEIVSKKLLELPRSGGINAHPCLYRYKGSNPIGRLLQDGCTRASVGVHRMTERVDEGEVLAEEFVDVTGKQSAEEVYNVLYPFYALALLNALRVLQTADDKPISGGGI